MGARKSILELGKEQDKRVLRYLEQNRYVVRMHYRIIWRWCMPRNLGVE
jgi:hypothetical protein